MAATPAEYPQSSTMPESAGRAPMISASAEPGHIPAFDSIVIRGARQNNLRNLNLELPANELVVVTGVSGSGKSSLVFDSLYAEGQRRYVETFSPYARQFLDRMDKPQVDAIEGIPPAIAIDQTNPVRTSRSTVGTMTELNDHLKLLYARAARLYCLGCGAPVQRDTPDTVAIQIAERAAHAGDPRLAITFPVEVPENFSEREVTALLAQQGYTRIHSRRGRVLEVVQDRFRAGRTDRSRVIEALEAALRTGRGRANVEVLPEAGSDERAQRPPGSTTWRFSSDLHCPDCDIHYRDPAPSLFSFNSPIGACETCRGFGRVIGLDYGLVVPDERLTLADGAVRPWQSASYRECQDDLIQYAKKRGVSITTPWRDLTHEEKRWVLEGEPHWKSWRSSWPGTWYGVARFFEWLETKAYKMHVRVLLSRYRAYTMCAACGGARLKTEALAWRLGRRAQADRVLAPGERLRAPGARFSPETLEALPGLTIHDLMLLPIERVRTFFDAWAESEPASKVGDDGGAMNGALGLLVDEIRTRIRYVCEVGLGYLTLDRQSRTLSGGEVQRINLTTALGTSLVNTLFVLDEPSIGLHPRDMGRVIDVMHRLRDAGNSLVVVEHDPQVMLAADRILDMGPGPGERGGEIVYFGPAQGILSAPGSLTGDYLAGRRGLAPQERSASTEPLPGEWLEVTGASAHNLKAIDVRIPLRRLTCVTGVSGSGKSTLVQDVLHAAARKALGKGSETPGSHTALIGLESIGDVVLVDQSPIGRTTRSNPASYVGAFDAIRRLFVREPLARERGYTAGTFSFNSGSGRCPTCSGNGYEHVEMQFLSDVYLRCPDCSGRRYRDEVLEVKIEGRSIADVLGMTVSEALGFFAGQPGLERALSPLVEVGLDYLTLGQPVPTLSGGEAQRLKLAGHLAGAAASAPRRASGLRSRPETPAAAHRQTLFLFDEPTTGLHFDDIAKLLGAFRRLIERGHSLIVIEHNLDVIRSADWIVDLGPEGGDAGGEVVACGTVEQVLACARSHTGRALREYLAAARVPTLREAATKPLRLEEAPMICVRGAREHNLQALDVDIPRGRLTVVSGISGSGKSTLAFDILFAEGQRRYLESLNAYARQFVQAASRPDVDLVAGLPPTVAIEQRASRGGHKSTVATLTELYHFLRLLYVKLGTQYCPDCNVRIEPQTVESIVAALLREHRGQRMGLLAPLVVNRKGYYTDLARWAAAKGYTHLRVDGAFVPTDRWPRLSRFIEHTIELPVAEVRIEPAEERRLRAELARALEAGKGVVHVLEGLDVLQRALEQRDGSLPRLPETIYSINRACPSCARSFPELDPRLFSFNSKHGWCPACYGTGLRIDEVGWDEERRRTGAEDRVLDSWLEWLEVEEPCPECHGRRLNRTALAVRFRSYTIATLTRMSVSALGHFVRGLELAGREAAIARDILPEIASRLAFLEEVGLGYLALDRAAPTLSGGEAQRIRLAAQLGSNLRGVCYVLDEPTIGLHPRDNRMLLETLERLQARGNTLIVVEHDEETIRRAAHVIDLGPGAGRQGGRLVATGTAEDLVRAPASVTGRCLGAPKRHPLQPARPVIPATPAIVMRGVALHNLKDLDVRVPLGRLVVITGVSGSGKSTLARDVLHDNLARLTAAGRGGRAVLAGCRSIEGWEAVGRVLEVDQTPIGKTPRSCPATYVGFWDAIRRLFAEVPEARMRGYTASRFSFNTSGGRCAACEGQGLTRIEMSFLPDVRVPCEACGGLRFNPETLAVRFKGRTVGDVLAMEVDEAIEFFAAHRTIHRCLALLKDVGLGYLTLGQQSPTLSGGEAQRIKLVTELAKAPAPAELHGSGGLSEVAATPRNMRSAACRHTLYVLDEPTVGLHMADVDRLVRVLHRLVEAGHSVVVIEHNLDVIAEADHIIDLGPEGGDAGGRIVAAGSPAEVASVSQDSHTASILAAFLAERGD
jgi:excinuclease ABC subunit A